MKTFICSRCRHIAFDRAPLTCPVCTAPIERFTENPQAINTPEDPNNLKDIEKKNIPFVTASNKCNQSHGDGCFIINVSIGQPWHVMENEHHINFIDFYINRQYIARVNFSNKRIYPAIALHLMADAGGKLAVVSNCNMHGSWLTEITL
jgi:superoxide reductase